MQGDSAERDPLPQSVAVSPIDASSDREQSDTDHLAITAGLAAAVQESDGSSQAILVELRTLNNSTQDLAAAVLLAKVSTLRFFISVALALATIAIIGMITLVFLRQQAVSTARAEESRKRIVTLQERIVSCTDPAGSCYKRGQAQTGAAVASINDVTILAAACAQTHQGYEPIRVCIVAALPKPK